LSLNLSASDLQIEADENKIEAIIDNLLSNAISSPRRRHHPRAAAPSAAPMR
jgi:signal transduction histidine kinase